MEDNPNLLLKIRDQLILLVYVYTVYTYILDAPSSVREILIHICLNV